MKKISLYILIGVIITNFFLPFGLVLENNFVEKNIAYAEDCSILSAVWNPAGEQKKDAPNKYFVEGLTIGKINVKTKGCVKAGVTLSVYEADTCVGSICDNALSASGLENREITIPSDNFTMPIKLGEEFCEAGSTGGVWGYDCDLYFQLKQGDKTLYTSKSKTGGDLYYECDGICNTKASLLTIIANGTTDEPVNIDAKKGEKLPNTYTLLAPIGAFKVAPDNIGDYFNTIFLIAIGLCGALAVIMIVIGGIQYMGDESIFGKTEAKSRIKSAIFGLLIALGSYALLNTINPALLGGNINIKQVSAEILEPPMLQESTQIPSPGAPINQCSAGIVPISTNGVNMHVCGSISIQVTNIIKTAWAANPQIKLSGAAFRSNADQVKLRTTNNCPDVYTSPASACKPPTAIPGTSMHESGLAIDFQCEGQSIQTKDNKCFIWLSQNAGPGLINFAKEPWHWSTNGK